MSNDPTSRSRQPHTDLLSTLLPALKHTHHIIRTILITLPLLRPPFPLITPALLALKVQQNTLILLGILDATTAKAHVHIRRVHSIAASRFLEEFLLSEGCFCAQAGVFVRGGRLPASCGS